MNELITSPPYFTPEPDLAWSLGERSPSGSPAGPHWLVASAPRPAPVGRVSVELGGTDRTTRPGGTEAVIKGWVIRAGVGVGVWENTEQTGT